MLAAENGHPECLSILLAHGADVDRARDVSGSTALIYAARKGHSECLSILLAHGAEVDKANEVSIV